MNYENRIYVSRNFIVSIFFRDKQSLMDSIPKKGDHGLCRCNIEDYNFFL